MEYAADRWVNAMSDVIATFLIRNATAGQAIGIKEALAMDVEKYGDTLVLSVDVREPEQMTISDAAPRERAQPPKPAPPKPPAQPVDKPTEAKPPKGRIAFTDCLHCAHYQSHPGKDESGKFFYGLCKRSGECVYSLGRWCRTWEERLEPL